MVEMHRPIRRLISLSGAAVAAAVVWFCHLRIRPRMVR